MTVRNAMLPLVLMTMLIAGFWPGPAVAHEEDQFGAGFEEGAEEMDPGFRPHPGMGRRGAGGPFGPPAEGLRFALRRLELSDQQREEIKTILEGERDQVEADHERMRALGAELREQIENDPYDEEAVRAKATAVASLRVEAAVVRARQFGQIRSVLTTEQLDQLEQMKEERSAFQGERRQRFERQRRQRRQRR